MTSPIDKLKATGQKVVGGVSDAGAYLYHRTNMYIGCRTTAHYTPGQIRDLLARAREVTGNAKTALKINGVLDVLNKAEVKLAETVKGIDDKMAEIEHWATLADAGCRISGAMRTLNDWDPNGGSVGNSEAAAKAFDELFGGVAVFVGCLPAPLNQYKIVFEDISKWSFVSHFRNKSNSMGSETPGGRLAKRVDESNPPGSQPMQ